MGDMTIPDAGKEHASALILGLTHIQGMAIQAEDEDVAVAASETFKKLIEENPQMMRSALIEQSEYLNAVHMPDELLDALGLTVEDNELAPAEDSMTDIEVE